MKNSINILMVGSNLNVKGGMTTLVESFLRHQFPSEIQLTYIASHSEKGRIFNSFFFAKSLLQILLHLLMRSPDIVHLHMSDKGSFVRKYIIFKIAKAFGKKVIVHTHGGDFRAFYERVPLAMKKQIHDMLKNADKIIALGNNWERIIREIEPQADVTVMMNSVPLPVCEETKKEKDVFTILFLAVLNESKGILDLIEASVPVIEKAKQENKILRFEIGGDGEMMAKAKKLVSFFQVEEAYRFHGWVERDKKEELLRNADLFVLPSYFEGLPMSILEAISYGVPVVSTDVGSIDEAVKEDVNGYLVTPGDLEALEDRLLAAIFHPSFNEMKLSSRKLADEKFNEDKYFKQLTGFYFTIHQESRPSPIKT